jgi:hypothetical protein
MTTYFSFHLSSRMIPSDCTIVRHELTDWYWIKRLVNDSVKMTTAFDVTLIKAVKEICNIDTSATNNNLGIIRLADGDSLIVAEVNNISKEKRIKLGQKVTNEDSYINFIKYNVSYFGDDDKQRLDELEYIKSSIEDIDIF